MVRDLDDVLSHIWFAHSAPHYTGSMVSPQVLIAEPTADRLTFTDAAATGTKARVVDIQVIWL
jgi:hypothetical protein